MTVTQKENFDLVNSLNRRYATKKFDSSRKLDDAVYKQLEDALRLSASSFGLQPWKFVVVTDPKIKAQLPAFSWGQTQPEECSHLVVICRIAELTEQYIDKYVSQIAGTRGVTVESLESYAGMMKGFLQRPGDKTHWMD